MRVLTINDISCMGRCSLTAALPIISAAGIEVSVLPTALLSTQTGGISGYSHLDLTDEMKKIVLHWKQLGIKFDAVYAGYMASEQLKIVAEIVSEMMTEDGKFFLDPVMGDAGELYDGFNPMYPEKMFKLAGAADYIFPNLTEACLLTDMPYGDFSHKTYSELLSKLGEKCDNVVMTGLLLDGGLIGVGWREKGVAGFSFSPAHEGFYHGAGDVFSSVMTAAILHGRRFFEAREIASEFVERAIKRTAFEKSDTRFGLDFEKEIPWLIKNF